MISLLAASVVIVVVGICDDRWGLRGRHKLFGQFLAAAIMIPSGILIKQIEIFGLTVEFGDLASLVTLFWILGAVNALNLIDGVDGLASTTGLILSLSIAAVAYVIGGRSDGMLISLMISGSLAGFLIYNSPPARMFLGDSGSMLIGLVLGCVALKCSLKQYTAMALVMPATIWAIPIFDVLMAIVRRKLTGRSIFMTDRAHLHHCMLRKGYSTQNLLLVVAGLCLITGVGAVMSAALQNDLAAAVGSFTAISLLVVTRTFGHVELKLLTNRARRFAGTMTRGRNDPQNPVLHDEQIRLHGKHQWEELWVTLTDFAEQLELDGVDLNVNVPSVGEEYHATWRRRTATKQNEAWKSEIPLVVRGLLVGHIRVEGAAGSCSICEWMSDLIGGLRPFEEQLIDLILELQRQHLPRKLIRSRPTSDPDMFQIPQGSPI